MDVAEAIAAVEASTGGVVCFHDFDGTIAAVVGERRIRHHHPVCVRAKAIASNRCIACDLHLSQAQLAEQPDGFWKLCHAGYVEAYVPLRAAGRNLGALFLGPWLWEGRESPTWALCQSGPRLASRTGAVPPTPAPDDRTRCLALARLLAAQIAIAAVEQGDTRLDRPQRILRLIDERLHGAFHLADLAAELQLSPSRCGHVVRAELGATFPALVDRRRLEQARRQLLATDASVTDIARRCGYASAGYFIRRFRQATGQTPEAFRQGGGA